MPENTIGSREQGFIYTSQQGWSHLRFERPQAGNRVSLDMLRAMTDLLRQESGRTGVILISGQGADFCLGRERSEQSSPVAPFDAFRPVAAFYRALSDFAGLTLSAVHGRALGFGVGIALRSDICLAADDASFTLDEVPHGIPPMFVLAELVDHLHPKHLMEMVMTGRSVDAAEAVALGIASRMHPAAELAQAAETAARRMAESHAGLIVACKRYMRQIRAVPHANRLDTALSAQTMYAVG